MAGGGRQSRVALTKQLVLEQELGELGQIDVSSAADAVPVPTRPATVGRAAALLKPTLLLRYYLMQDSLKFSGGHPFRSGLALNPAAKSDLL